MAVSTSTTSDTSTAPADEPAGGLGGGRLTAARGLFSAVSARVPDELYLHVTRGSAVGQRTRVVAHPHATLDTNTYFGRFPACHWQRWTDVASVDVELVVSGTGRIRVLATDRNADERTVDAAAVSGARAETVTLTAKLDRFLDAGALFCRIDTADDELVVESLRWVVDAHRLARPTSTVTCTYNRADDVLATMAALASDAEALALLEAVYVVDQGSHVVAEHPRFAEVKRALAGKLRYIRQPNLGGAGGFSRGMYEVLGAREEHGNVLLMDDDVLLEPEIVVRMTAFARSAAQPTLVGGQMLKLLHPSHILAGAEWANMAELEPGKVKDGALDHADLLDLDDDGIRARERRVDADYNAWWSCLIPIEAIEAIGYPLPLFFQWDDIEFGYRAAEQGFPTVTLPGAGLWHADFDWKDLDEWNRYFSIRNAMITAALHGRLDPIHTARVLLAQIVRNLLAMQYGLTATIIKAAEDFLAGPRILHDGGVSAAAEVRALRARYPETKIHAATELPGHKPGDLPQVLAGKPGNMRLMLLRRLADLLLGRAVHQAGSVAASDAKWWHVALFDTVAVTDSSQRGVRLRKRDTAKLVALFRYGAGVLKRVVVEAPSVKEQYRAAVPELTSRRNWQRLYGLNEISGQNGLGELAGASGEDARE